MNRRTVLIVTILILIVGIFIGRYSGPSLAPEKKPLYWIDSMEPTIHYPGPGKSRMGMELTPVYEEDQQSEVSNVRISPAVINNLGVRTSPVILGTFARRIETVGYVEPNENKISRINSYAEGWVKKLFVTTVGAAVKKDQVLLQFYSPTLVNAQEEYLIALGTGNQNLINASIKKLQALHISDVQIQQLKSSKKSSQLIDINSPQDGVLTELNVREGMHITPDTELMSIVDLSSIWMIAQVFEDQATWLHENETAEARLTAFPDKVWQGEVEYIYPQLDPTTRTIKVRFRFNNPDGILKPNMYAAILIYDESKSDVLSIPLEALIRSSEGDRVIVALKNGQFQVRSVVVGMESGERVEVMSGLKVGENVVSSGQFLIDSEANLNAGLQRLETEPETTAKQDKNSEEVNKLIEGKGVIKGIDNAKNLIKVQHEPIPALNWPSMTKDFNVDKAVNISQFKTGDSIRFTLIKDKDNNYLITDIKKTPP